MISINNREANKDVLDVMGLKLGSETDSFSKRVKRSILNTSQQTIYDAFVSLIMRGQFVDLITNKYYWSIDGQLTPPINDTDKFEITLTTEQLQLVDDFYNTFLNT